MRKRNTSVDLLEYRLLGVVLEDYSTLMGDVCIALFGVFIVGLLAGRIFWTKMQRNGLIRLEEADGEL
jgi:hypothetical protein